MSCRWLTPYDDRTQTARHERPLRQDRHAGHRHRRSPRHRPDLPWLAAGSGVPHAAEQPRPRSRGEPRAPRRVRRHGSRRPVVGCVPGDAAHADHARGRRDDARPVGQAGRRDAHPRVGAPGAHRQLEPRSRVGELGRVPPPRTSGPHHVRPDDRRIVDLHRHAGHPAGHLRVLRRDRSQAVRRHARRHAHDHCWRRGHGRRPAVGRDDERRCRAGDRRRPAHAAAARRPPLPRRDRSRLRVRGPPRRARQGPPDPPVGRPARQRRRPVAAPARRRSRGRHRHRPDERARSAELHAERPHARSRRRTTARRPDGVHPSSPGLHGDPLRGDGRVHGRRRRGVRLRQQLAGRGQARRLRARLRLPGLPAGIHTSAVLRRTGSVPLGRALRRSRRHRRDRPGGARGVP